MFQFPETEAKLKSLISRYKSSFKKEKQRYGSIHDGSGKRYVIFGLYFVLDDLEKSQEYFEWYAKEFSDDVGEPIQKFCWALGLYRMKRDAEAEHKLAELMLSNLYLIPIILGRNIEPYDMWHSSNMESLDYCETIPSQITDEIRGPEIQWIANRYDSPEFCRIREEHVKIFHALQNTRELEKRSTLLDQAGSLLDVLSDSSAGRTTDKASS